MRSIFDKSLYTGGLGTAPKPPAMQKVVIADYVSPTAQSLTYTEVPQAAADEVAKNEPVGCDFFKAPNPVVAEAAPASEDHGNGAHTDAAGNRPALKPDTWAGATTDYVKNPDFA
jgi:hypothetical protein